MFSKPTWRSFCGLLNSWHCNQLICWYHCLNRFANFLRRFGVLIAYSPALQLSLHIQIWRVQEKSCSHLSGEGREGTRKRERRGRGGGPDEIINSCDEELSQQIEMTGGCLGKVDGQQADTAKPIVLQRASLYFSDHIWCMAELVRWRGLL